MKARLERGKEEGGKGRMGGWTEEWVRETEEWVRGIVRVGVDWMIRVRRRKKMKDAGFGNEMFSGCGMTFPLIDHENISRQCGHRRLMFGESRQM